MGRKRNIFVRDFFTFDQNLNASVCKACSAKFMGENITNLKRHMIQAHIELYKQETEQLEDSSEDKRDKEKIKFSIEISKKDVTDACLEFLTKESLPLTFFDSDAFRNLTQQMFEGLKMEPINSQNICEILNNRYYQIKSHIIKYIKGHLVSIKLDMVTLHERSILCINMQILKNKKLVIYTLAIKDIRVIPTKEYLKNILEKVLDDYEISTQQIYTLTIDTGENILKDFDNEDDDEDHDGEEEYILTPDTLKRAQTAASVKEELKEINASEDNLILLTNMLEESSVIIIKCTTYAIQLAVQDFFSEPNVEKIIQRSCQAIDTLRSSSFHNTLQMLNLEKPVKAIAKNWISIFVILEALLKFKDLYSEPKDPLEKDAKDAFLQHIKEPLKKLKWIDIEELIMILKPVYECTLILQKQQLFLVDFYKSWLTLKSTLKSQYSERSTFLYSCLENRESQLMNTEISNAAKFLDPLLFRTLNPFDKDNARQHLKELAEKIIEMKPRNHSPLSKDPHLYNMPSTSRGTQSYITDESSNSSLLKELSVDRSNKEDIESEINREIQTASNEIDLYNPPLVDVDLMQYWEKKKYTLPYLRKLAYIIHAVPATQVSIEKAFTALQLVLDKEKEQLSDDLLDTIIFLKLNTGSE